MDFSYSFCRNIRYLRKEFNLTQKEMASILGVSTGTVRKIEKLSPSVRLHTGMVCRICQHFDLSADTLLRELLENRQI